jgi:ornithine decarboxylase
MDAIRREIEARQLQHNDNPFYVLNLEDVRIKLRKWREKIPRVTPFYAVKCNDNAEVLKALAEGGSGFDCASKSEIAKILSLGVVPERIIYANTVKQVSHLRFAAKVNVERVTFDTIEELEKIREHHPKAKVVLRIRFDSEDALLSLGTKFGCDLCTEAPLLIASCKEMQMNLIGVSFHVGS